MFHFCFFFLYFTLDCPSQQSYLRYSQSNVTVLDLRRPTLFVSLLNVVLGLTAEMTELTGLTSWVALCQTLQPYRVLD